MQQKEKTYFFLIIIHIALGIGVFLMPFLSKIYGVLILLSGVYFIIKRSNKNNEALIAAAYMVGAEVFLRMTDGVFLYEFGKYGVMIFILFGMFFSSFSKNAIPYWIFLLLLVPGILIATQTLNIDTNIRKRILFNISGPVCLGIASLYTFNRKITIQELNRILFIIGLPIITCAVYLILYVPDLKSVIKGTGSNFVTSGGFGPNQVSTILGLGMFLFFARAILFSKTKLSMIASLILATSIGYRGLVTFSRGGIITAILMLLIFLFFLYMNSRSSGKIKLSFISALTFVLLSAVWLYSQTQTNGLIAKRYANQDARGRIKESKFSGREKIANTEINAFLNNPVFGIGVAKAKEYREEQIGEEVNSHSEITRMLAEHGALGIIALFILIITPLVLYLNNKQHIYLFSFVVFWLLTINHAAMRIAAPAFVYSLSLLKVYFHEPETPIHRK